MLARRWGSWRVSSYRGNQFQFSNLALEGRPGGFVWSYFTRNKVTGSGIILAEGPEHRALKHLAGQMTKGFDGTPNVLVARVEEYVDVLIGSLQELVSFQICKLKA